MHRLSAPLALLLGLGACATPAGSSSAVAVTSLGVRLDAPSDGALTVRLAVPPLEAPACVVEWQLELDGLRVAEGFEQAAPPPGEPATIAFQSPLVFKAVPWRAGSAFARVRLRGVVRRSAGAVSGLPFSAEAEVLVRGRPDFASRRD